MESFELSRSRREAGVGQRELAAELGLAAQRLSEIENGIVPMSSGFPNRYTQALKLVVRRRLDRIENIDLA